MISTSGLAEIAALVGDPSRANMLNALMDGRALTAGELAYAARVTPPTASAHLARLADANLVSVVAQGRHRYYRLSSPLVAGMLESIMAVAAIQAPPRRIPPRANAALREGRTCYNHLAGRLGVALTDGMVSRGYVELGEDGGQITETGAAFLSALGIAVEGGKRPLCRPCLDWSERRPHLGGRLGAVLCSHCFEQGWIRRVSDSRAVAVTIQGAEMLKRHFGAELC